MFCASDQLLQSILCLEPFLDLKHEKYFSRDELQVFFYRYPVTYLLHFFWPISERHTAQHYLGCTEELRTRITDHRNGLAARFTEVAHEKGAYPLFLSVYGLVVAVLKEGLNAGRMAKSFVLSAPVIILYLSLI